MYGWELHESEWREREAASSGESWAHLLCSTQSGKKNFRADTLLLSYTHTCTCTYTTHTHTHSHAESWIALQGTCSVTWTSLHQQRESFALSGLFEVIRGSVIKRRYGQMHLPSATTLWQPWGYLLGVMGLCNRHAGTHKHTCDLPPFMCKWTRVCVLFERQHVSSNLCKEHLANSDVLMFLQLWRKIEAIFCYKDEEKRKKAGTTCAPRFKAKRKQTNLVL